MAEQDQIRSGDASELDKATALTENIIDWSAEFAPKLALTIIILMVGFWLVKKSVRSSPFL
jgi:hypothetical protein